MRLGTTRLVGRLIPTAVQALIVKDFYMLRRDLRNLSQLITPLINLSTALTATVDLDHYFRQYSSGQNEIADVDVKSSLTGGAWVNVLRQQGTSSSNPDHKSIDITAQAAGPGLD